MKRTAGIAFITGCAATTYVGISVLPMVTNAFGTVSEKLNPKVVYEPEERVHNAATSTANQTQDKMELYYREELVKLNSRYEQMQSDAAMTNAIERVEAELEVEKEKIRERAILQ